MGVVSGQRGACTLDGMAFTAPEYSKGKVRKAGKVLAGRRDQDISEEEARLIASNWRSAHAYPTWVIRAYLTSRLPKLGMDHVIASRTKKLPTIKSKLADGIVSDLSTMQDIGGCRVIVDTVEDVMSVVESLESGRSRVHSVARKKDYFEQPKDSGYRGVHLISKYDSDKKPSFKGMQVETQVRTKLIHNWATTVEAVDLMKGSSLKRSQGDDDWQRFFYLVADHMSRTEGTPRVIKGIGDYRIDREIRYLRNSLGISDVLTSWEHVNSASKPYGISDGWFVVALTEGDAVIYAYPTSRDAENAYEDFESDPEVNAVSVSAQDMETVRKVYPNYFFDCSEFRRYIDKI